MVAEDAPGEVLKGPDGVRDEDEAEGAAGGGGDVLRDDRSRSPVRRGLSDEIVAVPARDDGEEEIAGAGAAGVDDIAPDRKRRRAGDEPASRPPGHVLESELGHRHAPFISSSRARMTSISEKRIVPSLRIW